MRKYEPEILMALIACLALVLVHPPAEARAAIPVIPTAVVENVVRRAVCFDRTHTVQLRRDGGVEEMNLREYLIGVVMSEMPMSFAPEALRAQAIASRTYALHCRKHPDADVCDSADCCQRQAEEKELRERFGQAYAALRERARQAVDSTDGLVLTYDGALIDATFFACSGGMTEDAVEVWGTEVPYLRPVASPGEEDAGSYHSSTVLDPAAFARSIQAIAPEAVLEGDPSTWLGAEERTAGDGVRSLEVGGVALNGTQLRAAFGLRSTRFSLEWDGTCFCFDVYGAGHRVGMSQCGAQAMALAGATAERILKTYYTGVEISHI